MWQDVTQLREFYATPLGQVAHRLVLEAILRLWPQAAGQRVLGYGYAIPYLRPYRDGSAPTVAAMPAPQGVHGWPENGPQIACLAEETELPFPDMAFDRVLVVHGLEHSEQVRHLLRELWRVTAGEGRVLFVVPGRRGVWSRSDRTPFGWGRPYSLAQLRQLLSEQLFDPTRWDRALYLPPTGGRWMLRWAPLLERAGHRFLFRAAGVHLIEAVKQLYAPTGLGAVKAGKRAKVQVVGN
ncbi:MAG TPA: methyltransferase domain-containing protein [Kiloniellales bacterium]|nr:methyltransferase domain-containing protein [Kiloniellales bacterium]